MHPVMATTDPGSISVVHTLRDDGCNGTAGTKLSPTYQVHGDQEAAPGDHGVGALPANGHPAPDAPEPAPRVTWFTRFIVGWPVLSALLLLVILFGFVALIGIPEFQEGFEGYDARTLYEARVADGFEHARMQARDFMGGMREDDGAKNQRFEPLTQELGSYRTVFFFHSRSGDIFSEASLRSVVAVLEGVNAILTSDFCYRGTSAAGGANAACAAPYTLMSLTDTHKAGAEVDRSKLLDLMKRRDEVPGLPELLRLFVGTDADFDAGTGSWIQGHIRFGTPLPGYHNASHEEREQLAAYNDKFQVKGMLGPEPKAGGWIVQIDELLAAQQAANPDIQVFYGGKLFFPRIFGYVNIDIGYALVSLLLGPLFMYTF